MRSSNEISAGVVEVRDLRRDELDEAVAVVARGMRENPLHVAAYGSDPDRRLRCHARLTRALFEVFTDDGEHTMQRARPAFALVFVYYPDSGRLFLKARQRTKGRILDLVQRFGRAVLGEGAFTYAEMQALFGAKG